MGAQLETAAANTLFDMMRHSMLCNRPFLSYYQGNGEGGIRTLGTLLGYGALAKRCFRPLSHLTKSPSRTGTNGENMTENR